MRSCAAIFWGPTFDALTQDSLFRAIGVQEASWLGARKGSSWLSLWLKQPRPAARVMSQNRASKRRGWAVMAPFAPHVESSALPLLRKSQKPGMALVGAGHAGCRPPTSLGPRPWLTAHSIGGELWSSVHWAAEDVTISTSRRRRSCAVGPPCKTWRSGILPASCCDERRKSPRSLTKTETSTGSPPRSESESRKCAAARRARADELSETAPNNGTSQPPARSLLCIDGCEPGVVRSCQARVDVGSVRS